MNRLFEEMIDGFIKIQIVKNLLNCCHALYLQFCPDLSNCLRVCSRSRLGFLVLGTTVRLIYNISIQIYQLWYFHES